MNDLWLGSVNGERMTVPESMISNQSVRVAERYGRYEIDPERISSVALDASDQRAEV